MNIPYIPIITLLILVYIVLPIRSQFYGYLRETFVATACLFRCRDVLPLLPGKALALHYPTVYDGRCIPHPHWAGFSKLDCSTTKRVPVSNDMSSESSGRSVSNAALFGYRHYSSCGNIKYETPTQVGGVISTVLYGRGSNLT